MSDYPGLLEKVKQLSNVHVLCVGDVMLDHFVYGEVSRISPEAPVPVLQIQREQSMLGGAGNVVRNLSSLGASVTFVSATGDDPEADQVVGFLNQINCDAAITRERDRRTSVKRRYISHGQQLLRADCETTRPISPDTLTKLLESFRAALPSCHIVVVSDYAKGVLSGDNVQSFIALAKAAGKPLIVDPKGRDYPRYRNASVIKPNLRELAEATGMPVDTEDATTAAARNLLQQTDAEAVVVTRGAAGMMLILARGEVRMFTSQTREVFDVSGAGDTVAAMLAAALGAGIVIEQAVYLANVAAGLVVTKAGTAVVEYEDIRREFELMEFASSDKRLPNTESAADRTRYWRDSGLKVGLLVGAFESIGRFEVELLQEARGRCDKLVVGIIGDMDEPDALNSRFTENEGARAFVVASLACVDLVVVQKESRPDALIQLLQPDLIFESNEYPLRGDAPGASAGLNEQLGPPVGRGFSIPLTGIE